MLAELFVLQCRRVGQHFRTHTGAKILTTMGFVLVALLVAVGIYQFFFAGFRYLGQDNNTVEALSLYFYEIFLLILTSLILFSAIITGLYSLYRSRQNHWLISTPSFHLVPKLSLINSVTSSFWTLAIVFLPATLAMRETFNLSFTGLIAVLFAFFCYVLIITGLALILILCLSKTLLWLGQRFVWLKINFFKVTIATLFIFSLFLIFSWRQSISTDLISLFRAENADVTIISPQSVSQPFLFLPSHVLATTIFAWQSNQIWLLSKLIALLASLVAVIIALWWHWSHSFLNVWQALQEIGQKTNILNRKKNILLNIINRPFTAILYKEYVAVSRNGRSVLWFFFLILIWLMQAIVNMTLARSLHHHDISPNFNSAVAEALQFITASYFMAAFVLRFVFPAYSAEGKTVWQIATAPVSFTKSFLAKYVFFSTIFIIIGTVFGAVALAGLPLAFTESFGIALCFASAILFITALGLSLGAIFPNYETDDPAVISTTMPGIAVIIFSVLYGAVGGWLIYQAVLFGLAPIILFCLFSLLGVISLLFLATYLVKRHDSGRPLFS
ncbi:MAG: hypothetical protein WCK11_02100 [Candidatus Falkowbacteria bacterium]